MCPGSTLNFREGNVVYVTLFFVAPLCTRKNRPQSDLPSYSTSVACHATTAQITWRGMDSGGVRMVVGPVWNS